MFGFSFVAISLFTLSYCDKIRDPIGFHIEIIEIISMYQITNMLDFPFLSVPVRSAESFNDFKFWIRNLEPKPLQLYCSKLFVLL